LVPEYVYGYRSKDCRNNIFYLADDTIVYHAAALGIVHNLKNNTQRFFDKHTDDILSLARHPDKVQVATGEIGPKPMLYIWSTKTLEVVKSFKAVLKKGIVALAFSPSGKKLVAAALDTNHEVTVIDVAKGTNQVFKGGVEVIVGLAWSSESEFISVGVKHYKLWKDDGTSKNGSFGKANNLLSGAVRIRDKFLCGAADGTL